MLRRLLAALLASTIMAFALPLAAEDGVDAGQTTISVVTLNLYHDKADWPKRRMQIAEAFSRLKPDAIVLQEVIQTEATENQAEWLARQIGYAYLFVSVDPPERIQRYGNALLTPHPILLRDETRLEPLEDSRTAGLLRIDLRGVPVNIYATHLHHTAEGAAIRTQQLGDLTAFIARTSGDAPSIVGGDFNTVADALELEPLRAGFTDSFGTLHPDAGPDTTTLNRAWFDAPKRIDHIFFETARFEPVSSEILFTKPDAEGTWASDHHGVLSVFRIIDTNGSSER